MTTRFSLKDITRDDAAGHFLMLVMSEAARVAGRPVEVVEMFGLDEPEDPDERGVDVTITLNGVEVDFGAFLSTLEQHEDARINKQASEMLARKCGALSDAVWRLEQDVMARARVLFGGEDENGCYEPPAPDVLSRDRWLREALAFVAGDASDAEYSASRGSFHELLRTGLLLTGMSHGDLARSVECIPSSVTRWAEGVVTPLPGMQREVIKMLCQTVAT